MQVSNPTHIQCGAYPFQEAKLRAAPYPIGYSAMTPKQITAGSARSSQTPSPADGKSTCEGDRGAALMPICIAHTSGHDARVDRYFCRFVGRARSHVTAVCARI